MWVQHLAEKLFKHLRFYSLFDDSFSLLSLLWGTSTVIARFGIQEVLQTSWKKVLIRSFPLTLFPSMILNPHSSISFLQHPLLSWFLRSPLSCSWEVFQNFGFKHLPILPTAHFFSTLPPQSASYLPSISTQLVMTLICINLQCPYAEEYAFFLCYYPLCIIVIECGSISSISTASYANPKRKGLLKWNKR